MQREGEEENLVSLEDFSEFVLGHRLAADKSQDFSIPTYEDDDVPLAFSIDHWNPDLPPGHKKLDRMLERNVDYLDSQVHKGLKNVFVRRNFSLGEVIAERDSPNFGSILPFMPHHVFSRRDPELAANATVFMYEWRSRMTKQTSQRFLYVAIREIEEGDEVLVDNGLAYWLGEYKLPASHWWRSVTASSATDILLHPYDVEINYKIVRDHWYSLLLVMAAGQKRAETVMQEVRDGISAMVKREQEVEWLNERADAYLESAESLLQTLGDEKELIKTVKDIIDISVGNKKASLTAVRPDPTTFESLSVPELKRSESGKYANMQVNVSDVPELDYLLKVARDHRSYRRLPNVRLYSNAPRNLKVQNFKWTSSCNSNGENVKGKCIQVIWDDVGPAVDKNRLTVAEADFYTGPNLAFLIYLRRDPSSLDAPWRAYIERYSHEFASRMNIDNIKEIRASLVEQVRPILLANQAAPIPHPFMERTLLKAPLRDAVEVKGIGQMTEDGRAKVRFRAKKSSDDEMVDKLHRTWNATEAEFYTLGGFAKLMLNYDTTDWHPTWLAYAAKYESTQAVEVA